MPDPTPQPNHPSEALPLRPSVQQSATYGLLRVFGKIMEYASRDWVTLDLSSAQLKVLFILHYTSEEVGGYTVNQLADRLQIGASTASHLIEKLVQAGLAMRTDSQADRRIVHVGLSEDGVEMARTLWGGRDAAVSYWISQMAPDDLAALDRGIQALLVIARASSPQNTPGDLPPDSAD